MRAVVISHTYVEASLRGKLRALAGLGCAIAVAVPDRWVQLGLGEPMTTSWGDDNGVRVVPIPVGGPIGTPGAVRWSRTGLRKLFTDFRPDLIQIEEETWSLAASAASGHAARLEVPMTLFSSESVPRTYPLSIRWRRGRTLQRVNGIVGGNRIATSLLARARPGIPTAVIPQLGLRPPLDTPHNEHHGLAIGFVGRLVPEKGLDILFRACVKLLGKWTLTVVGSGPAQEELEALAERLGIAARVTWMGALPPEELRKLWPDLHCLAVPSRTTQRWVETFHQPLIEAMGHGVTVVGSDSGVIPELIDTAGLVVPEDNVPALTAALQHLADTPRERQRFGREGRQRVMAQYVDDAIARRTLDFWVRVLSGTGKRDLTASNAPSTF
ncbi:MAG: glycosyltransferase family 4 protein [Gemmatimonadota bacterium]